jgi:hypothetical protein
MNLYSISRWKGTSKAICEAVMRNIGTCMGTERPIDYPCATMDFALHLVYLLRVPISKGSTTIALYVTQFKAFHSSNERPVLLPATTITCTYNGVRLARSNTFANLSSPLDGTRFWAFSLICIDFFISIEQMGNDFFLFSRTHGQTHPWVVPLGTISKLKFFGLLTGPFNCYWAPVPISCVGSASFIQKFIA